MGMANVFECQRGEANGRLEVNRLFLQLQTKENGASYMASQPISDTKSTLPLSKKKKKKQLALISLTHYRYLTRNNVLRCGNMKLVKQKRKR